MNTSVVWDIRGVNRRLGGIYILHLQGRKVSEARNQHEANKNLFNLYRNVDGFIPDYTILCPKR
jgi:hypothetical protein